MADAVLVSSTRRDVKKRELWQRKMKETKKKMRISITRTELTILATSLITLIALALAPAWWGAAFGQESNTSQTQNSTNKAQTRTVGYGEHSTIEGIVIKRNSDTFTLRGSDGAETIVVLTDETTVKTVRKGLFRRDKSSGEGYIIRGLRLKAEGVGNIDGQLLASSICFDEEDLRTNKGIGSQTDSSEKTAVVPLTNLP